MDLYVFDYTERQPRLIQEMRSYHGRILKADHTRPLAEKVGTEAGVKWSYSIMNEYGEVISHAFTETDGDAQVKDLLVGLKRRYDSLSEPYPALCYIDKSCCGSTATMIKDVFGNGIHIRVDPFHILWRFSRSCSRSSHPGHGSFMQEMAQ
ncbi:hypothetical protein FOZ62_010195, partial [Perkinsus olseni]